MEYPLQLSFKLLAIASQVYTRDARGNLLYYVKQKLFKLKESITIFEDEQQTRPLFTINADRVLDFGARYHFADTTGRALGSVRRQGLRSIWKANYDILAGEQIVMKINEENGWIKVADALFSEVPIVGLFSGFVFNPSYLVTRIDQTPVLRLAKRPAFFEGKFELQQVGPMTPDEELRAVLAVIMMVLLERTRG